MVVSKPGLGLGQGISSCCCTLMLYCTSQYRVMLCCTSQYSCRLLALDHPIPPCSSLNQDYCHAELDKIIVTISTQQEYYISNRHLPYLRRPRAVELLSLDSHGIKVTQMVAFYHICHLACHS